MHPIVYLLYLALNILSILLIVWIIISWLVSFRVLNTSNRFVHAVYDTLNRLFEPLLRPIRRYMPDTGAVDLSPIVLILAIEFSRYTLLYYFN